MITRRTALRVSAATLGAAWSRTGKAQGQPLPIRIGVLEDMSGVFSDLGGPSTVVAAKMAVQDFGGSVLSRPIEVLAGDHQNKPDVGLAIGRRWYDVEKVSLIVGLTNSAVALGVHKLAADKDKIDIVVNAASDFLIEDNCSPNGILWNQSARSIVKSTVEQAGKSQGGSWYFITSDYAGGRIMETEARPIIQAMGDKFVGSVQPPLGAADFSSELLAAQSSGAKILGVVTFGQDFVNIMKQVDEFGLKRSMRIVAPFTYLSDLHAVGTAVVQGTTVAAPFYWDLNPETRAWSERFRKATGRAPDMGHGGTYGAVTHYLKAVSKAGTDETAPVLQAMREMPVNDMYTKDAFIRKDGMVVRPIYLFEGKKPSESRDPWDLLRQVGTVDKEVAFALPPNEKCKLLGS